MKPSLLVVSVFRLIGVLEGGIKEKMMQTQVANMPGHPNTFPCRGL